MIIQWIVLFIIICFIAFSYYKHYSLKTRLISLATLFILSLFLVIPIPGLNILTLLGLFLIEKIWILLTVVLFIEIALNKKNRTLRTILGIISLIIYFHLRTII